MNTQETENFLNKSKRLSTEVPQQGWVCIWTEDLGESRTICEMCKERSIRYVQGMWHPHYEEVLKVGCICAGHMEENSEAANAREATLKKRAKKRKVWISSPWDCGFSRGICKKIEGFRVTVAKSDQGWSMEIYTLCMAPVYQPKNTFFKTMDEAKLYAFDYLFPPKVPCKPTA